MQATAPVTEIQTTTPESRFSEAFQRLNGHVLNGKNARMRGLREDAMRRFEALGLPRKAEAWKYTNIARTLRHPYTVATETPTLSAADLDALHVPGLQARQVVLVNGAFAPALSDLEGLPEGVTVQPLRTALETHAGMVDAHLGQLASFENEALVALNTAFLRDGLFVHVRKNTALDRPIHLQHIVTGTQDMLVQPRVLVLVETTAQFTLLESYHSLTDARTFTNQVTEFFVGRGAHVDHYLLQDAGENASSVITLHAKQEADSVFDTATYTFSGDVVRNTLRVEQRGENGTSHLNGLFLADGTMHVDNQTRLDHAAPHSVSNELYKGVLDDASTGVFNGKVYVHPGAQQINAYQSNKSVLLSDRAKMNAKPELEIYADDVKCSHGATTGQLDQEALFYLRSRGLTEAQARALLLLAFARDVLDTVRLAPLRDWLDEKVAARFA